MRMIPIALPYPPGYNASYRTAAIKGKAVYYKTKVAKDWQAEATKIIADELSKAGITPERGRPFCWFAIYKLKSQKLDADAPEKLLMDAVRDAIGHDDNRLAVFTGSKQFCKRLEQSFTVWIAGRTVADNTEFNALSESFVDESLATLHAFTREH